MRVAAIQTTPLALDVAGNAVEHARLIAEAASDVCVFPELSLTGYELDPLSPITDEDGRLDPVRDACRTDEVYALVGAPLSTSDGVLVATLVVGPTGEVLGHYGKKHLHGGERELFVAGDHHLVLEVDDWRLGLAVCYDAAVPEHAEAVRAGGADAYLVSALFEEGTEQRLVEQATSAAELGMWVVLAQYTGRTGGHDTFGGSGVWRPGGVVQARLGREPGIARATLVRP
ncbi:carbon-nitrogen hydrolase family protein [Umezawaea sp.]|uniref:carbon-nitrogen hydrolase family protein n=1 Tax=Umezawaea sp. TaxID=1955258 RepID=UPI002ED46127